MALKSWKISYTKESLANSITVESANEPEMNFAALLVRKSVFGDDFVLIDTYRGDDEPTVAFLAHHGYKITSITELRQ